MRPFVRNFQPELLLVSAGYDAHWRDPMAALGLSTAGYAMLSRGLVNIAEESCQGRVVFLLEGGYDPHNVANGIEAGFAALTGDPQKEEEDACPHPEPDIAERLERTRKWHGWR
jgi:acetoin utilization deacetylase AcuC-like enzyme